MANDTLGSSEAIDIIVVTWNRLPIFKASLLNLLERTADAARFIIIDNQSNDGTWEWLQILKDPKIKIFQPQKRQAHHENNNFGLQFVRSELFVTTVDKMLVFNPDWLSTLAKVLDSNPEIGAVAPTAVSVPGSHFAGTWIGRGLKIVKGTFGAYLRMQRKSEIVALGFRPAPHRLHSEDRGFAMLLAEIGKTAVLDGSLSMMNLLQGPPLTPSKHSLFMQEYDKNKVQEWPIWRYAERFLKNGSFDQPEQDEKDSLRFG